VDIETQSTRVVEGTVTDVSFTGDDADQPRLALSDLGSYKSLTLDTDEGPVVVGGWGAVYEDVEMRTVALVGIEADVSSPTAETRHP
jgi:hypothetical protein